MSPFTKRQQKWDTHIHKHSHTLCARLLLFVDLALVLLQHLAKSHQQSFTAFFSNVAQVHGNQVVPNRKSTKHKTKFEKKKNVQKWLISNAIDEFFAFTKIAQLSRSRIHKIFRAVGPTPYTSNLLHSIFSTEWNASSTIHNKTVRQRRDHSHRQRATHM